MSRQTKSCTMSFAKTSISNPSSGFGLSNVLKALSSPDSIGDAIRLSIPEQGSRHAFGKNGRHTLHEPTKWTLKLVRLKVELLSGFTAVQFPRTHVSAICVALMSSQVALAWRTLRMGLTMSDS